MNRNKKRWNVLVFPGGTEIGAEIWRSLRFCKEVQLFSVSSRVGNHAPFMYKSHFEIEDIYTNGWIEQLNQVCKTNEIDWIIPANDLIIERLCDNREKISASLLLSDIETIDICLSKSESYKKFREILPVPDLYYTPEDVKNYPVFLKPDHGYGATGTIRIDNYEQLLHELNHQDRLILEYLPGKEYTIDCVNDKNGNNIFCSPRERSRIRMGTSMAAEIIRDNAFEDLVTDYAKKISDTILLKGAWFFQVKYDKNGELKLLEIEPRIAGTMAFNRARGINFPLLSLYIFSGFEVSLTPNIKNVRMDRILQNRFIWNHHYCRVYIDLDDTLIINGLINTSAVQYLYQCLNNGIERILISKSNETDKIAYLESLKLKEIFNEIIFLNESDKKSDYIINEGSIFIDDSFSERQEVSQSCNIPVFDPSMIEMLIDERI